MKLRGPLGTVPCVPHGAHHPPGSETSPSSCTGSCALIHRHGSRGIRASDPSSATYSFCDLGPLPPLSQSQFCFLQNEHDPCLVGSDVQVTPQGTRQREKRRRGSWEAAAGPRGRAAHVGGKHRRGPDAPRRRSGHSSPCAGLVPGRMKGPRSSPFEGALPHPGGQLEAMRCSLEPLTQARVASVYLSSYFNSSNAFLAGKKKKKMLNILM